MSRQTAFFLLVSILVAGTFAISATTVSAATVPAATVPAASEGTLDRPMTYSGSEAVAEQIKAQELELEIDTPCGIGPAIEPNGLDRALRSPSNVS